MEISNSEITKRVNSFNDLLCDRFVNGFTWKEIWNKYGIYKTDTQRAIKHTAHIMKNLICK